MDDLLRAQIAQQFERSDAPRPAPLHIQSVGASWRY